MCCPEPVLAKDGQFHLSVAVSSQLQLQLQLQNQNRGCLLSPQESLKLREPCKSRTDQQTKRRSSGRRGIGNEGDLQNTGFLSHLCIKLIFLPRQARDKHRENSPGAADRRHRCRRYRRGSRGRRPRSIPRRQRCRALLSHARSADPKTAAHAPDRSQPALPGSAALAHAARQPPLLRRWLRSPLPPPPPPRALLAWPGGPRSDQTTPLNSPPARKTTARFLCKWSFPMESDDLPRQARDKTESVHAATRKGTSVPSPSWQNDHFEDQVAQKSRRSRTEVASSSSSPASSSRSCVCV